MHKDRDAWATKARGSALGAHHSTIYVPPSASVQPVVKATPQEAPVVELMTKVKDVARVMSPSKILRAVTPRVPCIILYATEENPNPDWVKLGSRTGPTRIITRFTTALHQKKLELTKQAAAADELKVKKKAKQSTSTKMMKGNMMAKAFF